MSLLIAAASSGELAVVKMLVARGAADDDNDLFSAFTAARANNHSEIMAYLASLRLTSIEERL